MSFLCRLYGGVLTSRFLLLLCHYNSNLCKIFGKFHSSILILFEFVTRLHAVMAWLDHVRWYIPTWLDQFISMLPFSFNADVSRARRCDGVSSWRFIVRMRVFCYCALGMMIDSVVMCVSGIMVRYKIPSAAILITICKDRSSSMRLTC